MARTSWFTMVKEHGRELNLVCTQCGHDQWLTDETPGLEDQGGDTFTWVCQNRFCRTTNTTTGADIDFEG